MKSIVTSSVCAIALRAFAQTPANRRRSMVTSTSSGKVTGRRRAELPKLRRAFQRGVQLREIALAQRHRPASGTAVGGVREPHQPLARARLEQLDARREALVARSLRNRDLLQARRLAPRCRRRRHARQRSARCVTCPCRDRAGSATICPCSSSGRRSGARTAARAVTADGVAGRLGCAHDPARRRSATRDGKPDLGTSAARAHLPARLAVLAAVAAMATLESPQWPEGKARCPHRHPHRRGRALAVRMWASAGARSQSLRRRARRPGPRLSHHRERRRRSGSQRRRPPSAATAPTRDFDRPVALFEAAARS